MWNVTPKGHAMKTNPKYLSPAVIIENWRNRASEIEPDKARAIRALVDAYLPPMTEPALVACHELYGADYPAADTVSQQQLLAASAELKLDRTRPRRYATQYPLHAAVCTRFHDPGSPAHRAARRVLTALFASPPVENPDLYYGQLLSVRRCLMRALDAVTDERVDWRDAAEIFRRALADQRQAMDRRAGEDLLCFEKLIDGERKPGINVRNVTQSQTEGSGNIHERSVDIPMRDRLAGSPAASSRSREKALADREVRDDGTAVRIGETAYTPVAAAPSTDRDEPADAPGPTLVRRTTPSTLTPSDDHAAQRKAPRMAATNALAAATDPQRLAFGRLQEALETVADTPIQWAYVWLLLTTGMQPDRIAQLRVCTEVPSGEPPHCDLETLSFRLLDGPAAVGDGQNQVVTLVLPEALRLAFKEVAGNAPFAGIAKRIDHRCAYAFRNSPGTVPTAMRLRATAVMHIAPHACDEIARLALSGSYKLAYAAAAAYRQFAPGELQTLWEQTQGSLAASLGAHAQPSCKLSRYFDELRFGRPEPAGSTGSGRTLPLPVAGRLFRKLREAGKNAGARLLDPSLAERAWTDRLVQAMRLQAAMTYLLWGLATGARPVGSRTVFRIFDKGVVAAHHPAAYLSDKATAIYRERRVVPIIHSLTQQLAFHREACRIAQALLERRRWSVHDTREPSQIELPARLEIRRWGRAEWRIFRQRDFTETLTAAGLDPNRAIADNATRHTVATELRRKLPEPQLDALLGHARVGLGLFAPASAAPLDWAGLRQALEHVLREAGIQPATIEELDHAR